MKSKRKKLIKIVSLATAIAISTWANGGLRFDLNDTAYAVGDLTIDWGVPTGDPIFLVNDFNPGDTQTRVVSVTNNGAGFLPVGMRGVKTSETASLANVLDFIIMENSTPIYGEASPTGPKTLQEFFDESAGPFGISLSNLNPTDTKVYTFKVSLPLEAGNEFQNATVVFDLIIGIAVEIPAECSQINFDGDPIFGTSRGESLKGTNGNDIIFGFGGGDSIKGKGGDDCIIGGDGGDNLRGENGDDVMLGGDGGDSLAGGNGEDRLLGGDASDGLEGGNGQDILIGGVGSDGLKGGNGNDQLSGGEGSDGLQGNAGDDYLDGGPGSDGLNGGPGTDTCLNGEGFSSCEMP